MSFVNSTIFLLFCYYHLFEKVVSSEEGANVFATFHVRNQRTISKVRQIQEEFLQKDWRFARTFQPLNSLHVSLLFFHLERENFDNATKALVAAAKKFHRIWPKLTVSFVGLHQNKNVSLFVAPKAGKTVHALNKLHKILCAEFEQRGIPSLNPFHEPFHAHATILFLTGEEDKDLVKYWPGEERKWHGRRLGTETVEVLQLCNMTMDLRTRDYAVFYETKLDK